MNEHLDLSALDEEVKAEMKRAIESGEYESVQQLIQSAVWEWFSNRRLEDPAILARVRQFIQDGIDSGDAGTVSDVIGELRNN